MSKCEKCKHKGICKHEENMQKFEKEIQEKEKLLEYNSFHAEVKCKNYFDGKETMHFAPGVR